MKNPPTLVPVTQIARAAGVSDRTIRANLERLSETPDAIFVSGRLRMPLFASQRVDHIVELVNGTGLHTPAMEAVV